MDTCFWMPLLWVLGASVLAGLLGWFWGKKDSSGSSTNDVSKDLEIQNLKRDLTQVREKADNSLARLGRETAELQEKSNLWREKFNKLQLHTSGMELTSSSDDAELKDLQASYKLLEDENAQLLSEIDALKLTASTPVVAAPAAEITAPEKEIIDLSAELKDSYEEKIKSLEGKLKKSKAKLKKAKAKQRTTKEITKSIDIEVLKKLLDKVPLKKVSERVIKKK